MSQKDEEKKKKKKQSILENDSYVDALLETADAIYSVNITRDLLEQSFLKKGYLMIFPSEQQPPYGRYISIFLKIFMTLRENCARSISQREAFALHRSCTLVRHLKI